MNPAPRYVLADNWPVREFFPLMLDRLREPPLPVCAGVASTREELMQLVITAAPDVLLLCGRWIESEPEALLQQIRGLSPALPVLVLCLHPVPVEQIIRMVRAGVGGWLGPDTQSNREMADAISALCEHGRHLNRWITRAVWNEATQRSVRIPKMRQLRTLQYIWDGFSTKEISARLCVSPRTIEDERAALLRLAGVHDTVSLIRWGLCSGYIRVVEGDRSAS